MKIKPYGNLGIAEDEQIGVFTFELEASSTDSYTDKYPDNDNLNWPYVDYRYDSYTYKIGDYEIAPLGNRNMLPLEVREITRHNHLMPELLEKQVRFLYGSGPALYRTEIKNVDGKQVPVRVWLDEPRITDWLDSWQSKGAKDTWQKYLEKLIRDFYYMEAVVSQRRYGLGRRVSKRESLLYLQHIPVSDFRFATTKTLLHGIDYINRDKFELGMVADFRNINYLNYEIYNRFDPANPYKYPNPLTYCDCNSFGFRVYSYPSWYFGLKDWIRASNNNPKYVNSFLKNSLAAKLHVKIPGAWIERREETIKDRLAKKRAEFKKVNPTGTVPEELQYQYSYLMEEINQELNNLSDVLTGEGKNQGKFFTSFKYYTTRNEPEEWTIEPIDNRYKEFMEAIIKFDELSTKNIAAGKGLDPSISNLTSSGVISKSGTDTYYNYLIYLSLLTNAEDTVTQELNAAIRLRFPERRFRGIRVGFYHQVPQRQEDVSSDERISQTAA